MGNHGKVASPQERIRPSSPRASRQLWVTLTSDRMLSQLSKLPTLSETPCEIMLWHRAPTDCSELRIRAPTHVCALPLLAAHRASAAAGGRPGRRPALRARAASSPGAPPARPQTAPRRPWHCTRRPHHLYLQYQSSCSLLCSRCFAARSLRTHRSASCSGLLAGSKEAFQALARNFELVNLCDMMKVRLNCV